MNIFKKNNEKKTTQKLPMTGKVQKGFRAYCAVIAAATLVCGMSVTAFAASDPITVVNNLSDFIFGLIRAIGLILLGFGIVQVGLSLKSHDPSQRANGFLTLAGGIIITFALSPIQTFCVISLFAEAGDCLYFLFTALALPHFAEPCSSRLR
jgi:hypothetical protein